MAGNLSVKIADTSCNLHDGWQSCVCVCGGGGGGGGGLVPSRLANIFGNGSIHKHDKKYKRAKIPEINRINRAPKP